jgi:hypothetical protein
MPRANGTPTIGTQTAPAATAITAMVQAIFRAPRGIAIEAFMEVSYACKA